MTSELSLISTYNFNDIQFKCYRDNAESDTFWATREEIGLLLGYANPREAIKNIHMRNKERLDRFSSELKLSLLEGTRTVTREVTVYNFKGLLEICRYSNQPKANAVMDFLWEIADEIRRTGSYKSVEVSDLKKRELDIRGAEILKTILETPVFPLTDESKAVIAHEIVKIITGHEVLSMLPAVTEAWYSATEIGKNVGLSPQKVGTLANRNGLKPSIGESNDYGRWIYSKSQ